MKTRIFMIMTMAVLMACTKDKQSTPAPSLASQPGAATVSFSGYTWKVTSSGTETQGPGPNHFSRNSVWVDDKGYMHLKLSKNADNSWNCAELLMDKNLGYGTYQWQVEGDLGSFDKSIVFGMFNYSGNDGYDEMDIEYSKWGYPDNNKMLNYTLFPETGSPKSSIEVVYPFSLTGNLTTQRFIRDDKTVTFKSMNGFHDDDTGLFASKSWNEPDNSVSKLDMPVMMNLWLFRGVTPVDGKDVEIIIHSFKYTPR
jgi:hypothetical protein